MSDPLFGKRVWLTGAGAGIGRHLALRLARRGCLLGLTARSTGDLESLAEQIIQEGYEEPLVLSADVSDSLALEQAHNQFVESIGAVQILIANAGVYTPGSVFESSAKDTLNAMDINYGGLVRCVGLVLPGMKNAGNGRIVGVSSLVAYRGLPRAAAYCASKAAMTSYLESIRFDVEDSGIEVQVISPGFVKTRLTDKNDFSMPFRISAELAAGHIEKGMSRSSKEVFFPLQFAVLMKLMRILPFWLYHRIIKRGAVQ